MLARCNRQFEKVLPKHKLLLTSQDKQKASTARQVFRFNLLMPLFRKRTLSNAYTISHLRRIHIFVLSM